MIRRKHQIGLIIVFFFLFGTPIYCLSINDFIKLSYKGAPIRQVMLNSGDEILGMAGASPFTYNVLKQIKSKTIEAPNVLNNKESSILKRLENTHIAMVCGNLLISIFNDEGQLVSGFNIAGSYNEGFQCSITEITMNLFLISSISQNKSNYNLNLLEYSSGSFTIVKKYSQTISTSQDKQINCESFRNDQLYICSYNGAGIMAQVFDPSLKPLYTEMKFEGTTYYYSKLFRINGDQIIVFYMKKNALYGRILTSRNKIIEQGDAKPIVLEDSNFAFKSIDLAIISDDVLLAYLLSRTWIFIQKFYSDLKPNGNLIKIKSGTVDLCQASIGTFSLSEFGLIFSNTNNNYILLVEFPECNSKEYTLFTGQSQSIHEVAVKSNSKTKIRFTEMNPKVISENSLAVTIGKDVNFSGMQMSFSSGGTFEYTFIIIELMNGVDFHSLDCKITFTVCYSTCKTCLSIGNDDDHQCTKCINGLHFTEEEVNILKCVSTAPSNYYLDSNDDTFKKCHNLCATCKNIGNESNTNCLTCIPGYYKNPIHTTHCQNNDEDGYYKDPDSQEYKKCYESCKTCDSEGTDTDHKCNECKEGYNSVDGTDINCVSECADDQYYYQDGEEIKCTIDPVCPDEYPIYIPSRNECVKDCSKYDYYEYILNGQKICLPSCITNLVDIPLYFDEINKKCVEACLEINQKEDPETQNCVDDCSNNQYYDENTNQCVRDCPDETFIKDRECVTDCGDDLFTDTVNKICVENCPDDLFIDQKNCVDICDLHNMVNKHCVDECPSDLFEHDSKCIIECEDPLYEDKTQMKCVDECDDTIYIDEISKSCDFTCPPNMYKEPNSNICVIECSEGLFPNDVEKICQDTCPPGYYKNNIHGICVLSCAEDDLFADPILGECVEKCTKPLVENLITNVCMTQAELEKDLEDRINDLDSNINDLEDHYPNINQNNMSLEIINSTDKSSQSNTSSIDLGVCEAILKKIYNIPLDEPLLIAKIDRYNNETMTNDFEFVVYSQNKERLNLSYCESVPIIVEKPIVNPNLPEYSQGKDYISEGIDIFNPNDPFFNDICYPYTFNDTYDVPLELRQKEILLSSKTMCGESCTYEGIDYDRNKVKCDCSLKKKQTNNKGDKNIFDGIKKSNIILSKCYKLVFRLENFYSNIGFLMFFIIAVIQLIILCCFMWRKHDILMIYLSNIHNIALKKKKSTTDISSNLQSGKNSRVSLFSNSAQRKHSSSTETIDTNPMFNSTVNKLEKENNKKIEEDLNDMSYDSAVKCDNRSFLNIYCHYLITSHPISNTFIVQSNKKLRSVKVSIFFLEFSIDYALNAFFYSDTYVGYPYYNNNEYSFFYYLPKSIYANLLGIIIKKGMIFLSSSFFQLQSFQENVSAKGVLLKSREILRNYMKMLACYFTLMYIITLALWYYSSAFCAVYENTQNNWAISGTISLGISFIFPIFTALFFACLRKLSFKHKSEVLYRMTMIMSLKN